MEIVILLIKIYFKNGFPAQFSICVPLICL